MAIGADDCGLCLVQAVAQTRGGWFWDLRKGWPRRQRVEGQRTMLPPNAARARRAAGCETGKRTALSPRIDSAGPCSAKGHRGTRGLPPPSDYPVATHRCLYRGGDSSKESRLRDFNSMEVEVIAAALAPDSFRPDFQRPDFPMPVFPVPDLWPDQPDHSRTLKGFRDARRCCGPVRRVDPADHGGPRDAPPAGRYGPVIDV